MPYHEYLEYCDKNNLPEEEREKVLASVKVSITEPELEHCFKYVAMDIDDDEAIFLLSKMYQKLIEIQNIGIVDPTDIADRIQTVKSLLSHCWIVRGHFPGFENICRAVLNFNEPKFPLSDLIARLKETENDYVQKLEDLFDNPYSDNRYKIFSKYVDAITDKLQGAYGITNRQFIQLAMLNLTQFQFERILSGYILYPDKSSHTVKSICDNPYILFEEYEQVTSNISESTGDIFDNPIELFKIDIAYYPDINYTDKISIQSSFKYNDKRRVRALIIRHLLTLENSGDCFEEASNIEKALREYPLFYKSGDEYLLPTDFLLSATGDYLLHLEEKLKVVPANDTRYFYLIWLYECEKDIEKAFQTLLDEPDNTKSYTDLNEHLKRSIKKLSATLGSKFDEHTFMQERTRLYTNIFKKRLFVLAGNPGSGKSYELLNIIRDIEAQNETYILLAPTGKAALRLINDNDFKGIDASTIDKLIADVNSGKRTKQSVLNTNNIIIDEMSMVDLMKFHSLLDYINYKLPSFKRLILVGDPNQLPPIGYGKILRDIIYYCKTKSDYTDNYIELTTNCRLELANSKLLDLSGAFTYKGDIDESLKRLITSGKEEISEGLRIKYWDNEQNLYKSLADEFDYLCNENELTGTISEKLNLLFGLDKDGDFKITEGFNLEYFQIITPYKAAYFGSTFINDFIQEQFKPTDEYEILDGWFKQSDKVIRTKNYYASPLNRIVKKSSPGETFKLGSGREVKSYTWSLSSEDLPVRVFTVSEAGALLQTGNFYAMRDLLVREITDQNNERAREYKDKEGKVILKRVKSDGNEWLDTYYVYDGIGNLAYVLPPLLHKRSFPYAAASVDSIAFQYRYDARQRLIEKRVPGSGWTYIIYDALDRVVLVQNPVQRTNNKWLFTKYDAFDRPIMTGETVNATSYVTLRSTISQQAGFETKDSNNNYTLNNSTPAVLSAEVHTQTFYDNYQLPTPFQISTTHSFVMESTLIEGRGHPDTFFKRVKGQVTATLVRNLDTQAWLESVNYYNDRQQIIQTISRNSRNGMDRISIAYENGVSKSIIKTITRHNVGAQELAIIDRVEYDNEDRPITKYHKTGSMAEIRTANHVYNEIGQLVEKNLHSTTGQRWMQSEDYRYAISGALKSINELSTGVSDANDLFSMELFFEEGYALKQFNGNITGMRWRSARTGQEQSYGYVYDPLNRLRLAEYKRKDGAANTWTLDLDRYKEVVTGYDANGNIRGIQRNGQLANQTFGQIDNLVYSYNGNTLLKVRDMAGDAAGFKDDGTTTSDPVNDYQYDANGSLVKDDNKQIQTIEYNYFNLPRRVVKSNNEYIKYIYNALGQKMRQEVYSSTNVLQKATDYCGNFIYENNNLQFFSHADGRVVNKGSGQWQYQYFAKDHLGNNRMTYASEFTTFTADMETATNPAFTNYTRTEQDLFDHTDAGTVYRFAHRLTGASNSQVGLAKSLQVQAGDTVKVEVWAKYFGTTSGSSGLSTFANSLLTAFGLQAPVAGESGTPAAALNGYGNFVAGGGYSGTNTGPRGFLNILFFDKNYVLKDVAFQKLDESYVQPVGNLVKQPHQKLQRQIVADEPGFVYIYVSNEGYQIQDIYFDDMVIKHSYTQVHQEENYYPFGLAFNSYKRENSVQNRFLFNGGSELQTDLSLGWYSTLFRTYDPSTGRFMQVDPLADFFTGITPYSFAFDNPISYSDPDGLAPMWWLKLRANVKQAWYNVTGRGNQHAVIRPRNPIKSGVTEVGAKTAGQKPTASPRTTQVAKTYAKEETKKESKEQTDPVLPQQSEPDPVQQPEPIEPNPPADPVFRGKSIPENKSITFSAQIQFQRNTDQYINNSSNNKIISDLVKTLKDYPQLQLFIVGNAGTDYPGQVPHYGNSEKALSQEGELNGRPATIGTIMNSRAKAIYDALIKSGIDASRLDYGPGNVYPTPKGRTTSFILKN
jgi:RHS repeat-associated protein